MDDQQRPVLSVEQALERILAVVHTLEPERVPLLEAVDRVLAETVVATRDIPPLTNAAMDGYAVRGSDVVHVPVDLRLIGQAPAGTVSCAVVEHGTAVRIMTGAPLPAGADTVVPFEHTLQQDDRVQVLRATPIGANIRPAGEDVRAGQEILTPGKVLRPQEIGMLAALGRTHAQVIRRPRVAILATGDEVVSPGQTPAPGQIWDANSYTVAAQVQRYGGIPLLFGVVCDQEMQVRQKMRQAVQEQVDFIITSGGVSVGDFDLVKQVLAVEGEMHFWSLNMKPGRPLAFGVVSGIPLLGLPGNPVAAMVSTELFARPALRKMQGFTDWSVPRLRARLAQPIVRKDRRRHYLRVRLESSPEGWQAILTGDQGSGILSSLVLSDGLAIIPEDAEHLPAGAEVEVWLWH